MTTLPDGFSRGISHSGGPQMQPAPLPVLFVLHGTLAASPKGTVCESISRLDFINETNFNGTSPDGKLRCRTAPSCTALETGLRLVTPG
jgi:hypothetical protein